MITTKLFCRTLSENGFNFFAGVPDSLLKNFCACLTDTLTSDNYTITANEGAAVALAAGYYLATQKPAVVFMQNSGIGNAVNPLLSLTDEKVYHIPLLLIIGWRGEPGVKDEPQHITQGELTLPLLQVMGIENTILSCNDEEAAHQVQQAQAYITQTGKPYALVVKKNTFDSYTLNQKPAPYELTREQALEIAANYVTNTDVVVSTTGMLSRELFELRKKQGKPHTTDFLTVGSMGHASHIALGIALQKKNRRIFCFDGDGAVLMHAGALAIIGSKNCTNFYHIVFNNGAHDSVGGQPTVALSIGLAAIAKKCNYTYVYSVQTEQELKKCFEQLRTQKGTIFVEIKIAKGSRPDLGRPTTTPEQNKTAFMDFLAND